MMGIVKITDTSIDLTSKLSLLFPEVKTFYLTKYTPSVGLEERLQSNPAKYEPIVFKLAEQFRSTVGVLLPYWESIIIAAWQNKNARIFWNEAIRHTPAQSSERKISIAAELLNKDKINEIKTGSSAIDALALCSVCELKDGTVGYIPLMDFRAPPSSENLNEIENIISALKLSGAILQSGKSYHFIGFKLMNKDEMLKFLGRCILYAPITDTRYIGHRLIEGSCDLRITDSLIKNAIPRVERILNFDN